MVTLEVYIFKTKMYNENRYGLPYIAICNAAGAVMKWGNWIGTPGCEGELHIDIDMHPCILMRGQRDCKGKHGPKYCVLLKTGPTDWVGNKLSALKQLRGLVLAQQSASVLSPVATSSAIPRTKWIEVAKLKTN